MQVSDKFIISSQTVQPFTKVQRNFNMKEANSTDNCIGGSCSVPVPVSGPAQAKKMMSVENVDMNSTKTPVVNTDGSIELKGNEEPKDFKYNSYADWRAPTYNQWTRIYDDNCSEQNRLRIGSKPMKYFVNQYNSPQVDPFIDYTVIGNQKQYDVRNDYERSIPTRLNPLYPVSVLPYTTTPFLGNTSTDRQYVDTSSYLRWGSDLKNMKSQNGTTEVDFNRWEPGVYPQTVQNAGQFGMKLQQAGPDGYYDYTEQNNVILGNSAVPYFGLSSRNLLHNVVDLSGC
jgi:hypothetical protein